MSIEHVISSIDKSTGGPARSVTHLVEAIHSSSFDSKVNLNVVDSKNPVVKKFKNNTHKIKFFGKSFNNYYGKKNISIKNVQLVHSHGLWDLFLSNFIRVFRNKNIPYIITPRGMLEPWSLKQGKLKKKIALKLFQFKDLSNATCLHATAPMEVKSFRMLGLNNPIAMIPNGVNLSDYPYEIPTKNKNKILFLSRIHPKKGIENLIDAWSLLDSKIKDNWSIDIVGNGDENYINYLKSNIKEKGLSHKIIIKEPVFGKDKLALFREADLFVLPTFSENFGIVIAEALASFTPVITTKGAPWQDLQDFDCGWWIDIGVQPLKIALESAMNLDSESLHKKGVNGRLLVQEKYSIESVAKKMIQLYKWILTKENKPDFIDEVY